ncbi:MAG: HAD family hydrolase [Lachnospiraceae bacterium]
MIKLIAVDMDGTLLDAHSKVTEKTAEVIRKYQDQGGIFLVNTGRDYALASEPLRAAGVSCSYICSNGANVYEADGTLLKSDSLSADELCKIRNLCRKNGVHINYVTDRGILTDGTRAEMMEIFLKEVEEMKKDSGGEFSAEKTVSKLTDLADYIQYEQDIEQLLAENVPFYKLSMNCLDFEKLLEVKELLRTWPQLAVASSFRTNVEVNSNRVDKGKTLMEYIREHDIDQSEVMVIGDSENDLAMLSLPFGCTVAMGNALDCVKTVCKKTTLANTEDGVAYAIEHWAMQ